MAFETDTATVYQIRDRHRNEEVRERIPADYAGVMITDRGKSYDAAELSGVKQQKCLAHVQRSLSEVLDTKRGKARWFAERLKDLLKQALALWHERRAGPPVSDFAARVDRVQAAITSHLRARSLTDRDNQRLLEELGRHDRVDALTRFLDDPRIVNKLPERFGDDSSVHRWFQRWCKNGVFERVWAVLVQECDELGAVDWKWQSADGMLGKARFGGDKTGRNPADRGKVGSKKSVLVEADGRPLGAVIAGANVPDCKLLDETIEAVVVERPDPEEGEQNLCLDAGYDNPSGREAVERHGYVGHIRPVYEDRKPKRRPGRRKARRWVVERTLSWLSKCRGLPVRYDKHAENFLGLIQLACGLLWYRRLHRLKAA